MFSLKLFKDCSERDCSVSRGKSKQGYTTHTVSAILNQMYAV